MDCTVSVQVDNVSQPTKIFIKQIGSDDVKVYLIKFSEPACENCSAFHPFVKKLMTVHQDKIKLVIR